MRCDYLQTVRTPVHHSVNVHCVSKKFPYLKSLQLCQFLTDFQIFCIVGKCMKFATKPIRFYPPHHRHVATIPWEIKKSNLWPPVKCACDTTYSSLFFQQLINTTLCPAFLGKFVCQPLCCVPFKYKLFIKILSSSLYTMLVVDKHCSDVCCGEFSVPQIDHKNK